MRKWKSVKKNNGNSYKIYYNESIYNTKCKHLLFAYMTRALHISF